MTARFVIERQPMTEWTNRYVVTKAPGVDGPAIPDDEPVLVIRAQDILAVEIMDHYAGRYNMQEGASAAVRDRLLRHREALMEWRENNWDKVKTPD